MKNYSKMKKLYGTKAEISELFGVKLKTLGTDLTEMRRHPEFSDTILQVGQKRVYISIEGYENYLKYKDRKYHNHAKLC